MEHEHNMDEEILDAERNLEREQSSEDFDSEQENETDTKVENEKVDEQEKESFQQIGYFFNGREIIGPGGESWTKSVEHSSDSEEVAIHHEMLAQWRSGGDPIFRLPDHYDGGSGELHVTHMMLNPDGSVGYRIETFKIGENPQEEQHPIEARKTTETAETNLEWVEKFDAADNTAEERKLLESEKAAAETESLRETEQERRAAHIFEYKGGRRSKVVSPPTSTPRSGAVSSLNGIRMRRFTA